jgi:hypothetical protein
LARQWQGVAHVSAGYRRRARRCCRLLQDAIGADHLAADRADGAVAVQLLQRQRRRAIRQFHIVVQQQDARAAPPQARIAAEDS